MFGTHSVSICFLAFLFSPFEKECLFLFLISLILSLHINFGLILIICCMQPYLHESRHLHAVNRVRGSGGRFLSSKKVHQSDPNSYLTNSTSSRDSVEHEGSTSAFSSVRQDVHHNGISFQQQPDHMAFSVSSHMDITLQGNGTQQRAPVVR